MGRAHRGRTAAAMQVCDSVGDVDFAMAGVVTGFQLERTRFRHRAGLVAIVAESAAPVSKSAGWKLDQCLWPASAGLQYLLLPAASPRSFSVTMARYLNVEKEVGKMKT